MTTIKNPFKKEAPKTMTEALKKGLLNAVKLAFGLAVGFLFVHWMTGGQGIITATPGDIPSQTQVDRAPTQSLAEKVLEQHKDECWTGSQQPKADLPGAAIVQFPNGMVQYTTVHWKVDAAFNEALANIGFGDKVSKKLDPIALCI